MHMVALADHELRAMVLEHAEMIGRANSGELTAARLETVGETDRADIERDEARETRRRAEILGRLLAPHGVHAPDSRQLSLLSDGGGPL
jgi:hypothetical protein